MEFEKIVQKLAKQYKKKIVLPEGTEPRTLRAANIIIKEKIAEIILIGPPNKIKDFAKKEKLDYLQYATIIDPLNNDKIDEYAK